jgi:hypothetical protein
MKVIRDVESIAQLPEGQIRLHIETELNGLLEEFGESYTPSFHGWFVVLETVNDLYAPLALLPYSLISKLQDHAFDWLGKTNAHYEVLLIVNDNESVMVYLPASLLQNLPELESSLSALASPVA